MGGSDNAGLRIAAALGAGLAGIGWQLQAAAVVPPALALLSGAAGLACLVLARLWRNARWPARLIGWVLLGFAWASLLAHHRLAERLPAALEGQDLEVVGTISGLPRVGVEGVRFEFDVEAARRLPVHGGGPVEIPRRLSLGWYRGLVDGELQRSAADGLRAGQRWRLVVRLRQPHGTVNPHGFDLELWMFERRLRATGSVRPNALPAPALLDKRAAHPVHRWRQHIRDRIVDAVPDARAAGVLAALAVGDQASIDRDDWQVFRDSGTAHLMAISGLHVTMFAWLAAAVVGAAWRLHPRLMLWVPAPAAARWGGVALAAAYALLAGWGVPAQRTVWMLASAALLMSLGLRWPWLLVLMASAVPVAVVDPWAMLQPGFWLSFTAVGLLLASQPSTQAARPVDPRWAHRLAGAAGGALRTQVLASIGLAPLTLLLFQQVSVVGLLANLVAIPLVTLVITPLALAGVVLTPLWALGAVLLDGLGTALAWLAAWPMAVWRAPVAPFWAQAAGLLAALLAVLPLPWRLRGLALPLVLPMLLPPVERPEPGRFEMVAADIGQGNAVLVRTHRHLLLYDTGPATSRDSDAGQRVLVPLLQARGERRIDLLMLSHRDTDHVGGAASVLQAVPVAAMASSLEDGHPLRRAGLPHQPCAAGQRWVWDGVRFEVLHPDPAVGVASAPPNTRSCVLRVQDAEGFSALLTGDIEARQEAALVARHGAALRSDVLLVPHHGSRTSSSAMFLDAVAPAVALVQAGYRNRYGHPADDVARRYAERGIALVRSDRCGAWQWRDGHASCQRQQRRRYWQTFADAPQGASRSDPAARGQQTPAAP